MYQTHYAEQRKPSEEYKLYNSTYLTRKEKSTRIRSQSVVAYGIIRGLSGKYHKGGFQGVENILCILTEVLGT